MSQYGLRAQPDISISIYVRVLGLNLHFRNPEKILEGGESHVKSHTQYRFLLPDNGQLYGCFSQAERVPPVSRQVMQFPKPETILAHACL